MFSYWIKKRFGFSIIISVAVTIGYVFAFVLPYAQNATQNELAQSVYRDSEIDFDIPSPTKSQLQEIRNLDFVDEAFGYYITEANLNYDGTSIESKLMISDTVESVDITMFGVKRSIADSSISVDYPLIIGQDFASEYDLRIGDELSYGSFVLTVTRIVEPDTYKDCVLVLIQNGDLLDLIESKSNSYSGAYLSVNDVTAADRYLRSYRPEGRLRDRSVFDSDEEYQIHYDAWLNANYYNEITSFEERLNEVRLVDTSSIWAGSVAVLFVNLVCSILLFMRKTERLYFKTRKSKRGLSGYYIKTFISDMVFGLGAAIGSSYIYELVTDVYLVKRVQDKSAIIALSTIVLSCVVCLFISLAMLRKVRKTGQDNANQG